MSTTTSKQDKPVSSDPKRDELLARFAKLWREHWRAPMDWTLARVEAGQGDADALVRLDAMARTTATDSEARKLAWLARAHAAALRCAGAGRADAGAEFAALDRQLREARPEGGALVREVAAAGHACAPALAGR